MLMALLLLLLLRLRDCPAPEEERSGETKGTTRGDESQASCPLFIILYHPLGDIPEEPKQPLNPKP